MESPWEAKQGTSNGGGEVESGLFHYGCLGSIQWSAGPERKWDQKLENEQDESSFLCFLPCDYTYDDVFSACWHQMFDNFFSDWAQSDAKA